MVIKFFFRIQTDNLRNLGNRHSKSTGCYVPASPRSWRTSRQTAGIGQFNVTRLGKKTTATPCLHRWYELLFILRNAVCYTWPQPHSALLHPRISRNGFLMRRPQFNINRNLISLTVAGFVALAACPVASCDEPEPKATTSNPGCCGTSSSLVRYCGMIHENPRL